MKNRKKNRYLKRGHISERKLRDVLKCFSFDVTAQHAAHLTGLNRNTINALFNKLRERIATEWTDKIDQFSGEVEVDESYFGPKRVRGKKGRGAGKKTTVLDILHRDGKVYVERVENVGKKSLMPIIQKKVVTGSTVYTDGWPSYRSLTLKGYEHHFVIHSENEFARGKNHINGIESFWSFAKRRLAKFNGISNEKFFFHLKESEFRFNNRSQNLYKIILKNLLKMPL